MIFPPFWWRLNRPKDSDQSVFCLTCTQYKQADNDWGSWTQRLTLYNGALAVWWWLPAGLMTDKRMQIKTFSWRQFKLLFISPTGMEQWKEVFPVGHPPIHADSLWRREEKREGVFKINRREQMSSVTAQQALPPSLPLWMAILRWQLSIFWYQSQSHLAGCYSTLRQNPFICK